MPKRCANLAVSHRGAWRPDWHRLALLVGLLAVACSTSVTSGLPATAPPAVAPGKVTVRALDYRFSLPSSWPGGWVALTLLNNGSEPHQLQLARLMGRASLATLGDDFEHDPAAAFAQLTLAGGPDAVEPGGGQEVTVLLTQGSYVALDLAVGSDGMQNVRKGMIQAFTVGGPSIVQAPIAAGTLVERSFGFDIPPIPARPAILLVHNDSRDDSHEAAIVQLAASVQEADVLGFLRSPSGPPPFRFVGGMAALQPGQSGYLHLDLDPGRYVVFCAVTDPDTGRFHFDQGMIQTFTVS